MTDKKISFVFWNTVSNIDNGLWIWNGTYDKIKDYK